MNTGSQTLRTFIALPLPPEWTRQLAETIEVLQRATPAGVRWVSPDGIHLTLKFLGPTDARLVPSILDALTTNFAQAISPILALSGLGTFPSGRDPRVIWAGVTGGTEDLDDLHWRAEQAVSGHGWCADSRPFRPHLTLGRVRDRVDPKQRQTVANAVAACRLPVIPNWRPDTVRLYRSVLTPQGAQYSSLGEVQI
jgi:2'-5' RNA ligase